MLISVAESGGKLEHLEASCRKLEHVEETDLPSLIQTLKFLVALTETDLHPLTPTLKFLVVLTKTYLHIP